jgi:outer membrane lipoprotein SlyB
MNMSRIFGSRFRRSVLAASATLALGVTSLVALPAPQAQAGLLGGALGGGLVGGLIGGRRGARAGMIVGGIAGAAREQDKRDAAAAQQGQRVELERQRLEQERLELERDRLRLEQERLQMSR